MAENIQQQNGEPTVGGEAETSRYETGTIRSLALMSRPYMAPSPDQILKDRVANMLCMKARVVRHTLAPSPESEVQIPKTRRVGY